MGAATLLDEQLQPKPAFFAVQRALGGLIAAVRCVGGPGVPADGHNRRVAYRYLFEQLVRRELRQKYKGSALGVLWYLINPLVLMGAYYLMFGLIFKLDNDRRTTRCFSWSGSSSGSSSASPC